MALTSTQKRDFRRELSAFAKLAETYEARWSYVQYRPYTGLGAAPQTFHRNDCSSYLALLFYWAMRHSGVLVADPLGSHYSGWGNTDTAHTYLKAHEAPEGRYLVGDVALYLERDFEHHHVTVCRQRGDNASAVFTSFGREAGPEPHPVGYRTDLTGVYRHPALL